MASRLALKSLRAAARSEVSSAASGRARTAASAIANLRMGTPFYASPGADAAALLWGLDPRNNGHNARKSLAHRPHGERRFRRRRAMKTRPSLLVVLLSFPLVARAADAQPV